VFLSVLCFARERRGNLFPCGPKLDVYEPWTPEILERRHRLSHSNSFSGHPSPDTFPNATNLFRHRPASPGRVGGLSSFVSRILAC
jgi:hypothetical protein